MSRIERTVGGLFVVTVVATGAWLVMVNAITPWARLRLVPDSAAGLVIAAVATTTAAAACGWRLWRGGSGTDEIARFGDALAGHEDPAGPMGSIDGDIQD
jgi:hypothetical protein